MSKKHTARLPTFGVTDIRANAFSLNDALSGITRGSCDARTECSAITSDGLLAKDAVKTAGRDAVNLQRS